METGGAVTLNQTKPNQKKKKKKPMAVVLEILERGRICRVT